MQNLRRLLKMSNHQNRSRVIIQASNTARKGGGARSGAGRKNEGKIPVCYKLAPDVVKFLREHERPSSRLIEDAVRKFYGFDKNIS